jgi:hypothetical protein
MSARPDWRARYLSCEYRDRRAAVPPITFAIATRQVFRLKYLHDSAHEVAGHWRCHYNSPAVAVRPAVIGAMVAAVAALQQWRSVAAMPEMDPRPARHNLSPRKPVATENRIRDGADAADAAMGYPRFAMLDLLRLLSGLLVGLFRSHAAREAETAFLRQQLVVLQRSAPARLRLRSADRLIFVWLYRLCPSVREAAVVVKPETLVRWHRSGFRLWRCKSRRRVGRPAVPADIGI